jgi:hypothetical protein
MKILRVFLSLLLLSLAVGCGEENMLPSPSWWPLAAGQSWTMVSSATGDPTHFQVLAAPSGLCGNPQFILRITKTDAQDYWGPGRVASVDYTIRVEPDGTIHSPLSISYGTMDATGPQSGATVTPLPTNLVIPANPQNGFSIANPIAPGYGWYATSEDAAANDCASPYPASAPATVLWQTAITIDGDFLSAAYEESDPNHLGQCAWDAHETWVFQRGVGLVKIHVDELCFAPFDLVRR